MRRSVFIAALATAVLSSVAAAQPFPSRPIKLVIPFPAGSAGDLAYRPVAEELSPLLGQNVLMDPKPGGGSMVASLFVKSQPPDGYTLYGASNTVTVKSVVPDAQIDIRRDFTPIVTGFIAPMVLSVNAEQIKATTLKQLIDDARARPGQLNYASYGIGSGAHMFMELLLQATGVRMTHVPFQGTPQAAADTVAGRTQITGTVYGTVRPFLAAEGGSGKLRALVVSTAERSPLMPDVPGMREAGFPELDYPLWVGFFGPAGVPRDIVTKLNQAFNTALKSQKVLETTRRLGNVAVGGAPEELGRLVAREYNAYAKLVKETGVKLE